MLKVYCYNKCTTCKKALKWLDDNGIAYELADIKADHPDETALRSYHKTSGLPLKCFFFQQFHILILELCNIFRCHAHAYKQKYKITYKVYRIVYTWFFFCVTYNAT